MQLVSPSFINIVDIPDTHGIRVVIVRYFLVGGDK